MGREQGCGREWGANMLCSFAPTPTPGIAFPDQDLSGGLLQPQEFTWPLGEAQAQRGATGAPPGSPQVAAGSKLRFATLALLYCQFKIYFMPQEVENGLSLSLSSTSSLLCDVG